MSSRKTIDTEEISFSLSIEVRNRRGRTVLADITVDEVYSYNYYSYESDDEDESNNESNDVPSDGRKVFSDEELNTLIIHNSDTIEFGCRDPNFRKTYQFASNKVTIKQFVDAIIDFEKETRSMGSGIDRHHIFFEGIEPEEKNGPYYIHWGS